MQTADFEKTVKKRLVDLEQTQTWLCQEVSLKTGLFVDVPYLWRIFKGERNAPKVVAAIREILELPENKTDE